MKSRQKILHIRCINTHLDLRKLKGAQNSTTDELHDKPQYIKVRGKQNKSQKTGFYNANKTYK